MRNHSHIIFPKGNGRSVVQSNTKKVIDLIAPPTLVFEVGQKVSVTIYRGHDKNTADQLVKALEEKKERKIHVPLTNTSWNIKVEDIKLELVTPCEFDTQPTYEIVIKGELV